MGVVVAVIHDAQHADTGRPIAGVGLAHEGIVADIVSHGTAGKMYGRGLSLIGDRVEGGPRMLGSGIGRVDDNRQILNAASAVPAVLGDVGCLGM